MKPIKKGKETMLDDDYPQPEKGDKAFVQVRDYKDRTAILNWIEPEHLDSMMAEGAKDCAVLLLESVGTSKLAGHPEFFFYTICFLYRHSYELLLKGIIGHLIRFKLLTDKEYKPYRLSHNLLDLWNLANPGMLTIIKADRDSKGLKKKHAAAASILKEFHEIDPTGFNFRYAYNKHGQVAMKPKHRELRLDVDIFASVALKLYNHLEMLNMDTEDD